MQDQIDTLIGEGTTIVGNLRFKGGLHIDGKIDGSVICDAADAGILIVSDLARIKGDQFGWNISTDRSRAGDCR